MAVGGRDGIQISLNNCTWLSSHRAGTMKMSIGWTDGWMIDIGVEETGNRQGNWVLLDRDGGRFIHWLLFGIS